MTDADTCQLAVSGKTHRLLKSIAAVTRTTMTATADQAIQRHLRTMRPGLVAALDVHDEVSGDGNG